MTFFGAGLLLGVVGTAAIFGADPTLKPAQPPRVAAVAPDSVQLASLSQADCSFAPVVGASGKADGSVALQPTGANSSNAQVQDLLKAGKEAAAAGQARDAELSFLMACRAAKGVTDPNGLPLADAQYQLARHYADLAAAPNAQHRDELLKRAQALFTASVASYQQRYGADSDRARFAQQGLASVQQSLGTQVAGGPAAAASAAAPAASEASAASSVAAAASPASAAPAATAAASAPAVAQAQAKPAEPHKPAAKHKSERDAEATAATESPSGTEHRTASASRTEALPKPENTAEPRRESRPETSAEAEPRRPRAERPLVVAPEPLPPVEHRAETRRPRNEASADSSYSAPPQPSTGIVSGPPAAATGDANAGDPGQ